MNAPASIPRHAAALPPESFEQLRAEGLRLLRDLSGATWTDHNLHDPGITILEQLCYALTDLAYRADFPLADHLAGPRDKIHYKALALQPPHQVFPCRATTGADQRRWLLDQVEGLDDALLQTNEPDGLVNMVLELSQADAAAGDTRIAQAQRAYRAQRNLCEDLAGDVAPLREQMCELHAQIEIGGQRDAAELLAEIYDRCASHVAQTVRLRSLREELADGLPLEEIYAGPATQHGFIDRRDLDPNPQQLLFVGELAERIAQVDGVRELREFALYEGGARVAGSLPWHGPGWVLRLRVPGGDGDPEPMHVLLTRRGHPVPVALADMRSKYRDRRAAGRASRAHLKANQNADAVAALPRGTHRDLAHYLSVQEHFPAVYGLGRRGLPPSASVLRRVQVEQLRGYLALFEQVMAHGAQQLQHQRQLFSLRLAPNRSYWWQVLGDAQVSGLEALYLQPREGIEAHACAPFDPWADRKNRVLDHLLALYGESWAQDSLRQTLGHLDDAEADRLLLRAKAALLRLVATRGADRGGAFDDARPSWNRTDNTCVLQRRLNLLLGFGHQHSRPLTQAILQRHAGLGAAGAALALDSDELARSTAVPRADPEARPAPRQDGPRGGVLNADWLHSGVRRERYRVVPPKPDRPGPWRLLLLSGTPGHGWVLGEHADAAAAAAAAGRLRRALLHSSHDSEGLHLVEHVLLRPRRSDAPARRLEVPPGFHALRLSVVLPAWTVRTREPNFQRFAEDTLRINSPAHVAARCLWLDFDRMVRFETRWQEWLAARIADCAAAGADTAAADRLERAACDVIESLLDAPGAGHA